MTTLTIAPPTTSIALLGRAASPDPGSRRVYAVLGWSTDGRHQLQRLRHPRAAADCVSIELVDGASSDDQLHLRIGDGEVATTSSGQTWRTWSLRSIPASLRHLGLADAVRALAADLDGGLA